jgi:hypothetical protein
MSYEMSIWSIKIGIVLVLHAGNKIATFRDKSLNLRQSTCWSNLKYSLAKLF